MRRAISLLLRTCATIPGKTGNAFLFVAAGLRRAHEVDAEGAGEWSTFACSDAEVDAGLEPDERQFYSRFLPSQGHVLLVGCGGGRDLVALCSLGYQVSGIDRSVEALESARSQLVRRQLTASLRIGLVQQLHLEGVYDAVVFSLGCYSLIRGAETRIATLAHLRACLSAGGRILLSYHHLRRRQSPAGRWLVRTSARLSGADWRPEQGDVFSRHGYTTRVIRFRHDFTPEEIASECAAAGLQVVADEAGAVLRYAAAEAAP